MDKARWHQATKNLPTKSAKIRALDALGVSRADIARFLDIRYQHVRNVLTQERPTAAALHVAEAAAPFDLNDAEAVVEPDGRVTISPAAAEALGAGHGEVLVAIPRDGGLWIATRSASRQNARAMAQRLLAKDVDLQSDLQELRRMQVEREGRMARPFKA